MRAGVERGGKKEDVGCVKEAEFRSQNPDVVGDRLPFHVSRISSYLLGFTSDESFFPPASIQP